MRGQFFNVSSSLFLAFSSIGCGSSSGDTQDNDPGMEEMPNEPSDEQLDDNSETGNDSSGTGGMGVGGAPNDDDSEPSASCGDGIVDEGEECDEGENPPDACAYGEEECTVCSPQCERVSGIVSYCGDGIVDPTHGEQCDNGAGSQVEGCQAPCPTSCLPGTVCREAVNDCDVAEICDEDGSCPIDELAAALTPCGPDTSGTCDLQDTCDGAGLCVANDLPRADLCGECVAGASQVPEDHPTIQEAVDAAPVDHCILIAPGEYKEDVLVEKRLSLVGYQGALATTIRGTGATTVLIVNHSGAGTIYGLTLTGGGGNQGEGGGLYARRTSATFRNLIVRDNHIDVSEMAAEGGGIYAFHTSALFEDVLVESNSSTSDQYARGGGVNLFWGNPVLTNVRIIDNEAVKTGDGSSFGGGLDLYGTATSIQTVTNTVVAGNRATVGAGIFTNQGGDHVLTNVTVVGNQGSYDAGMYIAASMSPHLNNVIFAHNTATISGGGLSAHDATFSRENSNLFGNTPENFLGMDDRTGSQGNLSVEPQFVNIEGASTEWDLHLGVGFQCIDAGDAALLDPDGSRSDMGAYGGPGASGPWVDSN